jgi:hypothetical protein
MFDFGIIRCEESAVSSTIRQSSLFRNEPWEWWLHFNGHPRPILAAQAIDRRVLLFGRNEQ